jgi:hypothetical protein
MSSQTDYFAFSYAQCSPSLQSTPRSIRLHSVDISFPPVQSTFAVVQFVMNDPVSGQPTFMNPGLQLSLVSSRRLRIRIPPYYSQFYRSNSSNEMFTLIYNFGSKQTISLYPVITCRFYVAYDALVFVVPSVVTQRDTPTHQNDDLASVQSDLELLVLQDQSLVSS